MQFRLGEFVAAPPGTKFFVFESLMHAKDFRKSDLHLCIFWGNRERLMLVSASNWRREALD